MKVNTSKGYIVLPAEEQAESIPGNVLSWTTWEILDAQTSKIKDESPS